MDPEPNTQPLFIKILDLVLAWIDSAYRLDYTKQEATPFELGENAQDHSKEILRELHSDMRALRETELKMIPLFFQVCTFILAANLLALFNSSSTSAIIAFLLLAAFSLAFVALFWMQLHIRIAHDNATYWFLGARVTAIRTFWKISSFFEAASGRQSLGGGPGYKMSQRLVATAALFLIATIVAAVGIRLGVCCLERTL